MIIPAFICFLSQQKPVDKYTLEYFEEHFVVRNGSSVLRVPLRQPKAQPLASIMYRRDQTFAVWDDRGLTVRKDKAVSSTRLDYIPTSPKVFPRSEIIRLLPKFRSGDRKKTAASLSGSCRLGTNAFFLVRWEDHAKTPWMEVLMKVDLAATKPKPEFVARLDRLSYATARVDDRLYAAADSLYVITTDGARWGVSRIDPVSGNKFDTTELGEAFDGILTGPTGFAYVVERTDYGSRVAARVSLKTESRTDLIESSGHMHFVDAKLPELIVINRENAEVLHNGETGSEITLPHSAAARRIGKHVIVWSPFSEPKSATLYDPSRWTIVAKWSAP